ncbi:hypothetical protein ACFVUN_24750 [Kitasatospora griseola]|uniref:hypothetical protein n=1 Tax=Kitasatospora griseola TaxID=2064 RepID=UPI0036D7AA20
MSHTPGRRARVALTAAAAVSLGLLVPGSAGAAAGTPTVPTDLYNALRACSTDPNAPLFVGNGVEVEGITHHTDPSVTRVTAQFRYWPVADPTQITTVDRPYAIPGDEAATRLSSLADDTTYAWQMRTVDPANGAGSDWTASCYLSVDSTPPSAAPIVTTPDYPDEQWYPGGAPIEVRIDPNGVTDVAGYQFSWRGDFPVPTADIGPHGIPTYHDVYDDPESAVRAGSLGAPATLHLTPPAGWSSGPLQLTVRSLDRAGHPSPITNHMIFVLSTSPTVTSLTAPQFGRPVTLGLAPDAGTQAISPVVSYTVHNLRTYQDTVVPAGPDGTAETTLLLKDPNGERLEVTSTSANGWKSSNARWSAILDTTPTITSTDYPEYEPAGGVGVAGTFHLAPKVDGSLIASWTYSFGWGTEQTVPAGPNGEADFVHTPTASGWTDMEVWATTKDGIRLASGYYTFVVN